MSGLEVDLVPAQFAQIVASWRAPALVVTPASIDLDRDGPHAMVIGATGSGKTEFGCGMPDPLFFQFDSNMATLEKHPNIPYVVPNDTVLGSIQVGNTMGGVNWPGGAVDPRERIVCVEDAAELAPPHPHVVRLVAHALLPVGAGAIACRMARHALGFWGLRSDCLSQ